MSTVPSPEQDIYFQGFIIRATEETIRKIKHYICAETDARLIFQKKSVPYLKIVAVSTTSPEPEPPHNEFFFSTPPL